MRELHRTVIVPYTPAQMFDLVADVERYPEFVPWCADAQLLARDDDELTGRLEMAMGPLTGGLTTRNRLDPPEAMTLELVEGPFSELHGDWRFKPLGDCRLPGRPAHALCVLQSRQGPGAGRGL